ncbi:MAG TPA: translocation/assembly module TamB domain-containing protein, partial [Thermoanaerobaculia bacterium]|nr:translocation/assembly module TamB domain-containing protein [Thermoanaerobaculia bacterium]
MSDRDNEERPDEQPVEEAAEEENRPRRRRRRGRKRWILLRIFAWSAVTVVAAVALGHFLIGSGWGREKARGIAETQLSNYLGRPVTVGSVSELGLVPPHAEVEDVVIPGPRPDEPPFATIPRLRVTVAVQGVVKPIVTVESVEAERPELHLDFYEDGSNNLPQIEPGDGSGGRVEIRIGQLTVKQGIVHFGDRRVPVSFDAAPVRATLAGEAAADVPAGTLLATVVAQDLTAHLPDARPWGGSVLGRAEIGPGRLDLTYGRVQGPDLDARVTGGFTWGEGPESEEMPAADDGAGLRGELTIAATGGLALANRLGYLEEPVAGDFSFDGAVEVEPAGSRYGGRLASPAVSFMARRFSDVEATVEGGDEGVGVVVERAGHAGGELQATVRVEAVEEEGAPRPVTVDARGRGMALARLIDDLDLAASPVGGVRGATDADFAYRFTTAAPLDGDGRGEVRFTSASPGAAGLPLDGRVPLTVERGVLRFDGATVTSPGQRLTASGSWDLSASSGSFTYALASERVGRLASAVATPLGLAADGPPAWLPRSGTGRVEGTAEIGPPRGAAAEREIEAQALVELAAVVLTATDSRGRRLAFDRVSAPLVFADGTLATDDLALEGSGQRLFAAGRWNVESASGGGDFRLSTENLARLAALLPQAAEEPPPVWLPRGGRGRVSGRVERAADGTLTARADLDLEAVALPGNRLDTLTGSLRLAGDPAAEGDGGLRLDDLRLEAASGEGALLVAGSLPLPGGGEEPVDGVAAATAVDEDDGALAAWAARPLDLSLDAVDWPLGGLGELVPSLPALDGTLTGRVEVSGSFERPEGNAQVAAEELTVAGLALDRASLSARLADGRVAVERLRAAAPAGEVVVTGELAMDGSDLDLRVVSDGLDLAAEPIVARVPGALTGNLEIDATLTGSFEEPRLEGGLSGRRLALAGTPLGSDGAADLDLSWAAGEATVDGSLLGVVRLAGGGRLASDGVDLTVDLAGGDLDALLRLVSPTGVAGLDGEFAGRVEVTGESLGAVEATLTLDRLAAAYESHRIENLEPVVARWVDGRVVIDSFFLGEPGEESEVFVGGELAVAEEGIPLDLRVQADLDAAWLDLLPGGLDFGGRVRALATVDGRLAEPRINGQGEMIDGSLLLDALPHAIESIDAVVLFYPGRAVLDDAGARMAGGALRAGGEVTLPTAQRDLSYRFQLQAVDVAVRAPEGFLLRGDANISLSTVADGRLVAGSVDLDRAFYLEDVDVGITQLLRSVFEPSRLEAGTADPELAATQLNVAVRGPGALRVSNNVADLSGDVDLSLRGSLAAPVIFGRVDIDPGGDVVYAENEYEVERGRITFS